MKKITKLLMFLVLITSNVLGIRDYKELNYLEKTLFGGLIAPKTKLKEFKQKIAEEDNYLFTNVANPSLAERILIRGKKNPKDWFFTIFVYSILNEIEEQLNSKDGVKLDRFKKIYDRVYELREQKKRDIEEREENKKVKIEQKELEKIMYKTKKEKESFFKIYMSNLILSEKVKTPSLIYALEWLHNELIDAIKELNLNYIYEILEMAPYLVEGKVQISKKEVITIEEFIIELPENFEGVEETKRELLDKIYEIKESLSSWRANLKYSLCSIF